MMYTIAVILIVLWLIGLLTMSATLGGWVHVLLAVAVILILVKLFGGQGGGPTSSMPS